MTDQDNRDFLALACKRGDLEGVRALLNDDSSLWDAQHDGFPAAGRLRNQLSRPSKTGDDHRPVVTQLWLLGSIEKDCRIGAIEWLEPRVVPQAQQDRCSIWGEVDDGALPISSSFPREFGNRTIGTQRLIALVVDAHDGIVLATSGIDHHHPVIVENEELVACITSWKLFDRSTETWD